MTQPPRILVLTITLPAFAGIVLLVGLVTGTLSLSAATLYVALACTSLASAFFLRRFGRWRLPVIALLSAGLGYLCYTGLGLVIRHILPEDREWFLIELDWRLFAYSWERWWAPLQTPWLTEFLQFAYASFYFFPVVVGTVLFLNREDEAFASVNDRLVAGFLFSYCGYLLVPASSPYEFLSYGTELVGVGFRPQLHEALVGSTLIRRDCFPSGHTMITWYSAWLAWQRHPKVGLFLAFGAVCVTVATLYLRYHYLIDVIAGLVTCVLFAYLMERILGPFRELDRAAT